MDLSPYLTFGELEELIWPEVNASQEPDDNQGEQKLVFYLGDKEQDSRFSLYQALLSLKWRDDKDFNLDDGVWNFDDEDSLYYLITYRRFTKNTKKFVENFSDMEKYSKVVLQVLRRIHSLDIGLPVAFVNNGLDRKLSDQMEKDIWGEQPQNLPPWWIYLILSYPFLFRYETRDKFFRLAAHFQRQTIDIDLAAEEGFVSRNNIMVDAIQLMNEHASNHKPLEVTFNGEEGIGIGPTSEFYTMVCKEFAKCDFMWRKDDRFGLFPRPMLASSTEEAITNFVHLGKFVGKAIEDGMLLDIDFSKAFYKLILGKELSIHDIQSFEPGLGKMLLEFKELSRKKLTDSDLRYDGVPIEDLGFSFCVPGYEEFPSEFKNVAVDSNNLNEYVSFLKDATIGSGVSLQRDAFIEGFNQVFHREKYPTGIQTFSIFSVEEFEVHLCGERDKSWSLEELRMHIDFINGWMVKCAPIEDLLEILQEFDREQRRAFLQFVTARPRLPIGGLASLNPKLTVVVETAYTEKRLPSARTCVSQLTLPSYPSKDIMKGKLLCAIRDGQESFDYI